MLDAVIVGGGPAGSTAARLLALWGHSVALLTKPESPKRALAVSLPPSCRHLFDRLGVLEAVDAAGFYRTRGNTVWWGGGESERRSEDFAGDAAGYEVVLGDFDRLMLRLAENAGVDVRRDATVRAVDLADRSGGEGVGVRVEFEAGTIRGSATARWVLDCSGRAGVIARQGLRSGRQGMGAVVAGGYETLALAAVWRCEYGWDLPHPSHTLVESYRDGWAWSVPVAPDRRYFTVMVDPELTDLGGVDRLQSMYRAELAKTRRFAELLANATLQDGPWGFGASPHTADRFGGDNFLLVGDAASCLDPLSSFGVKKAMASAWLAAVVVHTCIRDPEMTDAAVEFFDAREREVYANYSKLSAQYFREVARDHEHQFWTGRSAGADEVGDVDAAEREPDIESLRKDPAVLAAFAALKASPSIDLRPGPSPQLSVVQRPAVVGHELKLVDSLVGPSAPSGLRFLRQVDLLKLAAMAGGGGGDGGGGGHSQVPDLFEAYNLTCPPVSLPDFLGALSVLLAKGLLENHATVA